MNCDVYVGSKTVHQCMEYERVINGLLRLAVKMLIKIYGKITVYALTVI
jgi:hypothetical protein